MSAIDALLRYLSGQPIHSRVRAAELALAEGDHARLVESASAIPVLTLAEAGGAVRHLGFVHGMNGPSVPAALVNLRLAALAMGADVVVGAAIMSFSTSAGFVANTTRPSFVAYGTAAAWSDTPPIDPSATPDISDISVESVG